MNPEQPSHPAPFDVGDLVAAHGLLAFRNSAGGTGTLQLGRDDAMLCRVTKAFWDYECGWRYHATLVAERDVARIRLAGTSAYGPDWYRANRPGDQVALAEARQALATFDPRHVFFSERDAIRVAQVAVSA